MDISSPLVWLLQAEYPKVQKESRQQHSSCSFLEMLYLPAWGLLFLLSGPEAWAGGRDLCSDPPELSKSGVSSLGQL